MGKISIDKLSRVHDFYLLTKPGIVRGNLVVAVAVYSYAVSGNYNIAVFIGLVTGLIAVISSACVFNNYMDRDIDRKMSRTKSRTLVTGKISTIQALAFAIILLITGVAILIVYVNLLTAMLAIFGHFAYVVLYGIAKRITVAGTILGSISGATPTLIGYSAALNTIDVIALMLFIILVLWQMPHFYAIALNRLKDYQAAGLPVLPVVRGIKRTKISIILYIAAFLISILSFFFLGYAGYTYLTIAGIAASIWLMGSLMYMKLPNYVLWSKGIFRASLIVILIFSIVIAIEPFVP